LILCGVRRRVGKGHADTVALSIDDRGDGIDADITGAVL
jgi:hypothetical protein